MSSNNPWQQCNDTELLAAAKAGVKGAMEALYERLQPGLVALIAASFPAIHRAGEADDIANAALFDLIRQCDPTTPEKQHVWLLRVATHKAIDWRRRRRPGQIAATAED